MITTEQLGKGLSYETYKQLIEALLHKGHTTGHEQTEDRVEFSRINLQRMSRIEKTMVLTEELKAAMQEITRMCTWIVITEGWCGDAAQNVPVLYKAAEQNPNIDLKLLLRDDNPEIMDLYLTNGARSIPKLICIDTITRKEIFTWGPRPAELQDRVVEFLKKGGSKDEKGLMVQNWYNADKTLSLQHELVTLIRLHMAA